MAIAAFIISLIALVVSGFTAWFTYQYSRSTKEIEKDGKREFSYRTFEDKFERIKTDYESITVVRGYNNQDVRKGLAALRIIFPLSNLPGIQNLIKTDSNCKIFLHIVNMMIALTDNIQQLDIKDRSAAIKSIKEYFNLFIRYNPF